MMEQRSQYSEYRERVKTHKGSGRASQRKWYVSCVLKGKWEFLREEGPRRTCQTRETNMHKNTSYSTFFPSIISMLALGTLAQSQQMLENQLKELSGFWFLTIQIYILHLFPLHPSRATKEFLVLFIFSGSFWVQMSISWDKLHIYLLFWCVYISKHFPIYDDVWISPAALRWKSGWRGGLTWQKREGHTACVML